MKIACLFTIENFYFILQICLKNSFFFSFQKSYRYSYRSCLLFAQQQPACQLMKMIQRKKNQQKCCKSRDKNNYLFVYIFFLLFQLSGSDQNHFENNYSIYKIVSNHLCSFIYKIVSNAFMHIYLMLPKK